MKTTSILNILAFFASAVILCSAEQRPLSSSLRGKPPRNLQTQTCFQECFDRNLNDDAILRCVDRCRQRRMTPSPTRAPAPTPLPTFSIINPISNRAIDVGSGNCEDEPSLELRSIDGNRLTQRFYFGPDNSIMSAGCDNKVITRSSDCADASAITLSKFTGGPHQQWEIQGQHIVSLSQDCDLVLDVFGRQTVDGAAIILYPQNGQDNQDFALED